MREVLPARHSSQALVSCAEFYAQYAGWVHDFVHFLSCAGWGFFMRSRHNQSLYWAIYFS